MLLNKALSGCEKSKEALEWLTRFNNEYHKSVFRKGDKEVLHNTKELRRDCTRRDYARRNDLYTSAPIVRNLCDL